MAKSHVLLGAGIMVALTGSAQSATISNGLPIHASHPINLTPANSGSSSAITRVDLPLTTIALLHHVDDVQQALNYQVLDASGHAMPTRIVTQYDAAQETLAPLRVYHWPEQPPTTRAAAANLELQLNQDQAHAWVTWPNAASHTRPKTDGADQTWLLAMPIPEPDQTLSVTKLVLTWPSSALAIEANVEGSSDLINWTQAGHSALLDTGQGSAEHAQLKQSSIAVDQSYRYWRITLSAPLILSNATVVLRDAEKPKLQSQQVTFIKDSSADIWTLSLPQPIAALGFKFAIPMNQVWSLSLARSASPDVVTNPASSAWQTLRTQQLSHWQTPPPGEVADNQTLWLDGHEQNAAQSTAYATQWQLRGTGPQGPQLAATLYGPLQSVYFIAQGQAPYHLVVNDPAYSDAAHGTNTLSLPQSLPNLQWATLGAAEIIAPATPWKTYALWAILIMAVIGLAVAALRLLRGLDQQPS